MASSTSIGRGASRPTRERHREQVEQRPDLVRGQPGGQFPDLGVEPFGQAAFIGSGQPGADVVLGKPAHPTEIAQAAEVPDQRHVGIGDAVAAVADVQLLRGAEH
ncbi:MAG: hypothetical protein ACRDSI_06655 [Pseudonocardiaceae bacterium]